MKIEIIKCLKDNYSYIIIDETSLNACVIDPSESTPIIDFIENNNVKLKYILNTHHHYDHIGGNIELKKKYGSSVIGFKGDKDRIPEIDILVNDNQIWKENNFEAKIYHIPGHTSGHIAFHFFKEKLKNGLPTVPSMLDDEIQCNIFLKAKDLQSFSKLRDLKDNF